MIIDSLSLLLPFIAVAVAAAALARIILLQLQLKQVATGMRNSLETGVLKLSKGTTNTQLQALILFIQELLLRQRENEVARNQYQLSSQGAVGESEGPLCVVEEVKSRLLTTLIELGEIIGCAVLIGEPTNLKIDSLRLRRGAVDRRMSNTILSGTEDILLSKDYSKSGPVLYSVSRLSHGSGSLKEIGVRSILVSDLHSPLGRLVIWIGLSKGISSLNQAEVERLRDIASVSLQLIQLLTRMKQILIDERENILGMSHDLRTPGITAMYVLNDLVTSPDLDLSEEIVNKIGVAERCLRDQLAGITDFIQVGRIDGGAIKLRVSLFEVRVVLLEIISLYELQALGRGVKLMTEISGPILIRSDETLFRRIVSNIISNVVKYAASGEACLTAEQLGAEIVIRVENATAASFSSSNDSRSSLTSTGLGLRVTERLAKLLGGEFTFSKVSHDLVRSELRLRSVVVERNQLQDEVVGDSSRYGYHRALVIDDDRATARMHYRYVQEIAQRISLAASIDEAISLLETEEYDLILSDLIFETGPSVDTLLNYLSATGNRARVILISGSLSDELLLLNDNPVPRLIKPISKSDLLNLIETEEIQRTNTRLNHSTI